MPHHPSPSTPLQTAVTLGMLLLGTQSARAAEIPADPTSYRALLGTLQPGDTLVLAPGTYPRLTLEGLHGNPEGWITITGPTSGDPAVIVGESCCNTVQLYDSSYVAVRHLTIDALGLYVDAVNAKGTPSHHILIENNIMQGFPADEQQIVGVNTKTTVWNWTIRGNRILEAGTGIYLGGSEGDTPFIAGLIENNVVIHPLGYCMQIKHQNSYALGREMPAGPNRTIIRNNVFIKDDRPSPSGDRPSLLVGGFPDDGPGSTDSYQIYGNLLFGNPREALFQATGRVSIHDNIFVSPSSPYPALVLTGHQGKAVKLAHVYNNTIYADGTGISFSQMASEQDGVVGNLIFAATPIGGSIADQRDNLVAGVADAGDYVNNPVETLGEMDLYPRAGAAQGSPLDLSKFADEPDYDLDFNGVSKGDQTFRGAYAGAGENPCGPLDADAKDCVAPGSDDGGGGSDEGGGASDDTGPGGSDDGGLDSFGEAQTDGSAGGATDGTGATTGSTAQDAEASGCGCTAGGGVGHLAWLWGVAAWRRRRAAPR